MSKDKEMTLETAFEALDQLLVKMEARDLPLEEAFKLYQEGTQLIAFCNSSIDKVEKQIIEINGAGEDGTV